MAIYFIRNELTKNVRIGYSDSSEAALKRYQANTDCPLTLVASVEGGRALEREYHNTWYQYRLHEEEDRGSAWFAIDVDRVGAELRITGREVQRPAKTRGRARKSNPRRHQLCLRLDDHQLELLQAYRQLKGVKTEVDAVRCMIDGLEGWLTRRQAEAEAAAHSGQPRPDTSLTEASHTSDAAATDDETANESQEDAAEEAPSLGSFGGRVNPGIPGIQMED